MEADPVLHRAIISWINEELVNNFRQYRQQLQTSDILEYAFTRAGHRKGIVWGQSNDVKEEAHAHRESTGEESTSIPWKYPPERTRSLSLRAVHCEQRCDSSRNRVEIAFSGLSHATDSLCVWLSLDVTSMSMKLGKVTRWTSSTWLAVLCVISFVSFAVCCKTSFARSCRESGKRESID